MGCDGILRRFKSYPLDFTTTVLYSYGFKAGDDSASFPNGGYENIFTLTNFANSPIVGCIIASLKDISFEFNVFLIAVFGCVEYGWPKTFFHVESCLAKPP